jgi:regulator of replication initiation timing
MRQALVVAMASAVAVLVTDVAFKSTLLRTLWPTVVTPADGAIATTPVTVRWEGPQPLEVTLSSSGRREQLGLRHSPFELDESFFPQPGQYAIELRSPTFGRFTRTERRFLVRPPRRTAKPAGPRPAAPTDVSQAIAALNDRIGALEDERRLLEGKSTSLFQENETLRGENDDLSSSLTELRTLQEQADSRLAAMETQQGELARAYRSMLEENAHLRGRLESVPPCTTWGYLSFPRPQTVPPTRQVVLVSDARGVIFRDLPNCEFVRRSDGTAASSCYCVGSPWG